MSTLNQEDFTSSFFILFKETFEGPPADRGSAYLDKDAALFQTLDALSAEDASARPRGGGPTVAAHCEHVRFYVLALYDFMRGATGKVDWERSWVRQTVTPAEWEQLRAELRRAYETVAAHLRALDSWGDEEVGDGLAIVVHTAYHLGAIRQIVKTVDSTHRQ
jgi:hypothetical protein